MAVDSILEFPHLTRKARGESKIVKGIKKEVKKAVETYKYKTSKKELVDEYHNTNTEVLTPLKQVVFKWKEGNREQVRDITSSLESDMEYFSRTRDLEVNTDRTKRLEDVVKLMTAGADVDITRVVIMRKGEEADAFVTPDGTIFISQSAINEAGSFTAVCGILAHEVGHLINNTFLEMIKSNDKYKLGLEWTHEAVADSMAPKLLEKTGKINSLGFALAIKRISGVGRGLIHQGGIARAAENIFVHYAIDFDTSHIAEEPLGNLEAKVSGKTNLEIAGEAIKRKDLPYIKEIFAKLHPEDLAKAFELLNFDYSFKKVSEAIFTTYYSEVSRRLLEKGYSLGEARIFCLSLSEVFLHPLNLGIKDVSETKKFVSDLALFTEPNKIRKMKEAVFRKESEIEVYYSNLSTFVLDIYDPFTVDAYDKDYFKMKRGVPVDRDAFFDLLEVLMATHDSNFSDRFSGVMIKDTKERYISCFVLNYIDAVFLVNARDEKDIDWDQVKDFLEDVKESGVKFDVDILVEYKKRGGSNYAVNGYLEKAPHLRKHVFQLVSEVYREESEINDESMAEFTAMLSKDKRNWFEIDEIIKRFKTFFELRNMDNEERSSFLEKFRNLLFSTDFECNYDILDQINNPQRRLDQITDEHLIASRDINIHERNNQIIRFNLAMVFGGNLFLKTGLSFMIIWKER